MTIFDDYDAWCAERVELSEQEEHGTDPDDWASSDDEAVDLLHRAIEALRSMAPRSAS